MPIKTVEVTAPTTELVTTADAKAHLRVDFSDDDTYIDNLVIMARELLERQTGRAFLAQTWDLFLDHFPGGYISLPRAIPLASVTGVFYTPDAASELTYSDSNYLVDTVTEPGRIVLKTASVWPGDALDPVNGVRVRYVIGKSSAADVPERAKQVIKLMVGHLYENREAVVIAQGVSIAELPMGTRMLIGSLQKSWF